VLAESNAKNAMLQMTTTLENSETQLQWNFAENINDGRGITFGCIGFCTGTYDGNILIKYYTTLSPNNPLAKYIPALDKIDTGSHNAAGGDGNPSVAGLDGFINDVHNCNDPLFKQAQLYELDKMYYNPAIAEANSIGAKYPLTQALLYDASVREGPDGMKSLVSKSGSISDEVSFDRNFISQYTAALKKEGLGDTDRMAGFTTVLNSGNYNLVTPFKFTAYGDAFTITGDLGGITDSSSGGTSAQKTTPTITWNNPADIIYGTALSKTQLNAAASVPGTFTYSPVAGTILGAGAHKLNVDFAPTDTVKYNIASKDVTINILGEPTANLKAAFDATPTSGTAPLKVEFTDKSTNVNSIKWNFGDKSGTSNNSKTSYTYANVGTYIVTLTAYKGANSDVATKTITVTKPALKINAIKADIIEGNTPITVKFSCGVSGKPTSYTWIFNKQTVRGDARGRVAYTFTKPGVYDVTLLVKDASGHTDKITKKAFIRVLPKVHRSFQYKIIK
jgi:chitosanase